MRLFKDRPTRKQYDKVVEQLHGQGEQIALLETALLNARNEAYASREEARRFRTELKTERQRWNNFVYELALRNTSAAARIEEYFQYVSDRTDELVSEVVEVEGQ